VTRDDRLAERVLAATEALESALLGIELIPGGVEPAPIEAAFGAALAALDELGVARGAELASRFDRAVSRVREARAEVAVADVGDAARAIAARLEQVLRELADARASLAAAAEGRPPEPPPAAPSFVLSRGLPALHTLAREPLAPRILPARRSIPASDAPLQRAATKLLAVSSRPVSLARALERGDGAAQSDEPPSSSRQPLRLGARDPDARHLARLARGAFEDIGSLSLLLHPVGDERWTHGIARFEERLLHGLDFVAALALPYVPSSDADATAAPSSCRFDVLSALLDYTSEAPAHDRARAFVRAFVLGCVSGPDTVRAALFGVRQSDPRTLDAQRHALALASNPVIDLALARLAEHGDDGLASFALEALADRGTLDYDVASAALSKRDPAARAAAARGLAFADDRVRARHLLSERLPRERDGRAWVALIEALLLLGSTEALAAARASLDHPGDAPARIDDAAGDELAVLLALTGGKRDAELLAARFVARVEAAEALGWHGHPALVEPLLAARASERADRRARLAIGRALHRITGLLPPAPGRGPDDAPRDPYEPELDPHAWRRAWEARRRDVPPDRRLRFGRAFTAAESLDELTRFDVPAAVRRRAAFEVNAFAVGRARIRVDDWSARQSASVAALRAVLVDRQGGDMRGAWLGDRSLGGGR
jgi:hypothetical protein